MNETTVGVSQVADCGIGGSPLLAALPAVAQRKTFWCGPEKAIGPEEWAVDELELVAVLLPLPALVAAGHDPALSERQSGDDALELVIPLGVRPEGGRDIGAVEGYVDVVEIRLGGHRDLDPRVAARDVLRRARDDTDLELVVLLLRTVVAVRHGGRDDDKRGDQRRRESAGHSFHASSPRDGR
jgi:hypothetical protein